MSGTFDVIRVILASAVADSGTFTADYPALRDAGDYRGGFDHKISTNTYGTLSVAAGTAAFSFGTASITVTNNSGETMAAGTECFLQVDRAGSDDANAALADPGSMSEMSLIKINLGAPDVADANGVVESQAATALAGLATGINGALATGGAATFDVPRNVVAAWTTTAVLTVTGTDEYGAAVVESSASGTSLAGKKAFKTVTGISVSADVTGLTVGSGDVLGLPVFLAEVGDVLKELEDGSAPTAGTVVAGVATKATATTGDVRGTYDPNSACNGAKAFQLTAVIGATDYKGTAQFSG